MIRKIAVAALFVGCALFMSVSFATAAEDIFKLVPESASGFVVINQPGALDAKLHELGQKIQLPVPKLLELVKKQLGVNEGINENETVGLVLLPPKDGDPMPTIILLIPVADYDKFLAQFKPEDAKETVAKITVAETSCLVRNIGGYAAISDMAHREELEKTIKLSSKVPAALASWRDWLSANDVGGVILKPGLQRIVAQVLEGIQTTKMSLSNGPEQMRQMAGIFDVYEKLFQAAEKEVSAYGIGLQLDKQDVLRLVSRAQLTPRGQWADMLAQAKPDKEGLLKGLPGGPFFVAGGGVVPTSVWEVLLKYSTDMMKTMPGVYGLTEDQVKKMPKFSFDSMKSVRAMSVLMGSSVGEEALYSNLISIMKVDNTKEFMAAYEKDMVKYAEFAKAVNSPMMQPIEMEKTEVGGVPSLKFTMHAPNTMMNSPMGSQEKIIEAFFGKEGKLDGWIVPADDYVVIGYVNKERLTKAIETIKKGESGLAGDASVSSTAALLPKDPLSVGYLSPQGTIQFVKGMMAAFSPPGMSMEGMIPEFPNTPPIGLAVTSAPNEVQTVLVLPAEVLKAIGEYIGNFMPAHGVMQ